MKVVGYSDIVSNNHLDKIKMLWEKFYTNDLKQVIKKRICDDVIAVYTKYTGYIPI